MAASQETSEDHESYAPLPPAYDPLRPLVSTPENHTGLTGELNLWQRQILEKTVRQTDWKLRDLDRSGAPGTIFSPLLSEQAVQLQLDAIAYTAAGILQQSATPYVVTPAAGALPLYERITGELRRHRPDATERVLIAEIAGTHKQQSGYARLRSIDPAGLNPEHPALMADDIGDTVTTLLTLVAGRLDNLPDAGTLHSALEDAQLILSRGLRAGVNGAYRQAIDVLIEAMRRTNVVFAPAYSKNPVFYAQLDAKLEHTDGTWADLQRQILNDAPPVAYDWDQWLMGGGGMLDTGIPVAEILADTQLGDDARVAQLAPLTLRIGASLPSLVELDQTRGYGVMREITAETFRTTYLQLSHN